MSQKILVTGVAGFIGSAVVARLLQLHPDAEITGIDNINDYYNPSLKIRRLQLLGIDNPDASTNMSLHGQWETFPWNRMILSTIYPKYEFMRANLQDVETMERLFAQNKFDIVINLAAQAGVRYSITNPRAYIESNINGFINILEGCRNSHVKHLVYASSSSVYGLNNKTPFSESDGIAHPVSLYAATKKSNELMAHAYSQLYGIPTTGLRFFTVYGPWGRPDMSPYLFIDAIMNNREIKVFNNGDMWRDFTYIDDIVEGVVRIMEVVPQANVEWNAKDANPAASSAPYRIYNIGNSHPTNLKDYIEIIEKVSGKTAIKKMLPMQPGDVYQTYSDSSALEQATGFRPQTSLEQGLRNTVYWYQSEVKNLV